MVIMLATLSLDLVASKTFTYFSGEGQSWVEASDECESRGGSLAVIHSEAENDAAYSSLDGETRAYIGLHDRTTEGSFEWVDGSSYDFSYWSPGEPNSWGGNEDCAGFRFEETWNDFSCNGYDIGNAIGYVCQDISDGLSVGAVIAIVVSAICLCACVSGYVYYRVSGKACGRKPPPDTVAVHAPEEETQAKLVPSAPSVEPAAQIPGEPNKIKVLKELNELLKAGALTQEEFDIEKKKILAGPNGVWNA